MTDTVEIPSTSEKQPVASALATNIATQARPVVVQEQPRPKEPSGAAFAALDRRQKATLAQERELDRKRQEIEAKEKSYAELHGLNPLELIDRIAKARGVSEDEILREYIARKTGQPAPDKVLEESKDPAIQALKARMDQDAKEKAELKKALEERDARDAAAIRQAAVAKAQADCLASAQSVFTDESEFPMFFEDAEDLGAAVYSECSRVITKYIEDNKCSPDPDEVEQLVKNMPEELLKKKLATKNGQRLATLKAQAAAPPLAVPGFKPRIRVSSTTDETSKKTPLRTKPDREGRLAAAAARWPKDVPLPGEVPRSE